MKVFIDTSVIVNSYLVSEDGTEASKTIMKNISEGNVIGFISEITLIEAGAAITRRSKDIFKSREFVENLICFPNMIILPITSSVVETALDLGIEKGLRAGDCIQVATALVHDIELFVERDRDFQRAKDLLEILSPEDANQKIEATLE